MLIAHKLVHTFRLSVFADLRLQYGLGAAGISGVTDMYVRPSWSAVCNTVHQTTEPAHELPSTDASFVDTGVDKIAV